MNKSKVRIFSFFVCGLVMVQFFQNCGQGFDFDSSGLGGMSLGSNHPGFAVIEPSSQAPVLANRFYMKNLLLDNFTSNDLSADQKKALETITNQWIFNKTGAYGYPCDPRVDSGSCDGTIVSTMNVGTNTLRSAFKSQACQTIVSSDLYLKAFVSKTGSSSAAPSEASLAMAYELFYRGDDVDPALVAGLLNSDRVIYRRNPTMTPLDRWRYIVLAICESAGWEQH